MWHIAALILFLKLKIILENKVNLGTEDRLVDRNIVIPIAIHYFSNCSKEWKECLSTKPFFLTKRKMEILFKLSFSDYLLYDFLVVAKVMETFPLIKLDMKAVV